MNMFNKIAMTISSTASATVNTTASRDVMKNLVFHNNGFFTDERGNLIPLSLVPSFTVMGIKFTLSEDKTSVVFTAGNCGSHCNIRESSWKKELWTILSLDPVEISAVFKSSPPKIWRSFRAAAMAADVTLSQKELIEVGFDLNEVIKGSLDLVAASSCDQSIKDGAKSIFDKTNRTPTPGWEQIWDGKE